MNKAEMRIDKTTKQNVLFVNDVPQFCAYKSPSIMKSDLGGMNVLQFTCNSNCPLMSIENDIISLLCGCERVQLKNVTEKEK